jgi:hypothetical protein
MGTVVHPAERIAKSAWTHSARLRRQDRHRVPGASAEGQQSERELADDLSDLCPPQMAPGTVALDQLCVASGIGLDPSPEHARQRVVRHPLSPRAQPANRAAPELDGSAGRPSRE